MTRIAFVVPGLDTLGGAEIQVVLLAKELRKRGWQVDVVVLSGTGDKVAIELKAGGVGFTSLEMRKGIADPRGWVRMNRWLRRETPDIVHAHLPHATFVARWSRILAPVRAVINTVHTVHAGPLGRRLGYRWSDWLSDGTTAVCEEVASACRSHALTPRNKLDVVPNGIETSKWRPDQTARETMRKHLGIGLEFVWLAVGRLDAVKDYATLLRAFVGLPPTALLLIAGSGPLEASLLRLADELKVGTRVRFMGFQEDVCSLMQAADGFVLASRWEGLPLTLIEAGSCELPAVATDVCGSHEIIEQGKTGFLVPANNAAALQVTMASMMALPPEERVIMGASARQRIEERYELAHVVDQWESLYAKLLTGRSRGRRRGC
jgi:glycosyltransferase involved in cell wall biosynthesis